MVANAKAVQSPLEDCTMAGVPIADEMARCTFPRKGINELLSDPFCRWMECGVRPNSLPALQVNNDDAVHELEANHGDNEQIRGRNGIFMIVDKCLTRLSSRPGFSTYVYSY